MGLIDKIKDNFTKAEFTVAPQKKLKTISSEFEKVFGNYRLSGIQTAPHHRGFGRAAELHAGAN